ncbi:MAG: DUF5110 domain-containing protein, partial [Flavobacteriales bacterium]
NSKGRRMYMPRGNWYHLWDDVYYEGGKEMWIDADLDSAPIFVKEGAIIPKYPIQQYVGEVEVKEVALDVYFKQGKERSYLYDDGHDGYNYTKGLYSYRNFKLKGTENELIIQQHKSGKFNASYESFKVTLKGLPFSISKIEIDKVELDLALLNRDDNSFVLAKNFSEIHVVG